MTEKERTVMVRTSLPEHPSSSYQFPFRAGSSIARRLISTGSLADICEGDVENTGESVCIKVVKSQYIEKEEFFYDEVDALSLLSHPHIVSMYEKGSSDYGYFITMESVRGISLRHFILYENLNIPKALDIFLQISEGIEHMHKAGLIHRDIKPENIMLTTAGIIKIIDFGLVTKSDSTKGVKNLLVGTPSYMAPEVLASCDYSIKTDVYALGIVLYELLTGKMSYGQHDVSRIPLGLQQILITSISSSNKRYDSIKEMREEILSYMKSDSYRIDIFAQTYNLNIWNIVHRTEQTYLPTRRFLYVGETKIDVCNSISYDKDTSQQQYIVTDSWTTEKGICIIVIQYIMRDITDKTALLSSAFISGVVHPYKEDFSIHPEELLYALQQSLSKSDKGFCIQNIQLFSVDHNSTLTHTTLASTATYVEEIAIEESGIIFLTTSSSKFTFLPEKIYVIGINSGASLIKEQLTKLFKVEEYSMKRIVDDIARCCIEKKIPCLIAYNKEGHLCGSSVD